MVLSLRLKVSVALLLKRGAKLWLHPADALSPVPLGGIAESEKLLGGRIAVLILDVEIDPVFVVQRGIQTDADIVVVARHGGDDAVIFSGARARSAEE